MKTIILDSSILLSYSSMSRYGIRVLSQLAEKNIITVVIPSIVLNEVIGNKIDERKRSVEKILSELENIRYYEESEEYLKIKQIAKMVNVLKDSSEKCCEQELEEYFKKANCKVEEIKCSDYKYAVENYFKGYAPFKSKRQKEHLLDAIIYQFVVRKSKELEVVFICKDNNLRASIQEEEINTYESIESMFSEQEFKEILKKNKLFNSNELFMADYKKEIYKKIADTIKERLIEYILDDSNFIENCTVIHDIYDVLLVEENEIRIEDNGKMAQTHCEVIFSANTYKRQYKKELSEVKKIVAHAQIEINLPEKIKYNIKSIEEIDICIKQLWNVIIID